MIERGGGERGEMEREGGSIASETEKDGKLGIGK